jgi:phosphinothricin acetyltransferase
MAARPGVVGEPRIRRVRARDAEAIAALYRPYVEQSRITFELTPPDAAEIGARIARYGDRFPWLVAEAQDGTLAGYAYATMFRERPAYRFAAETSIYLAPMAQGHGAGLALYSLLLDILAAQGFVHAVGAITLPNPASEALHLRAGFAPSGAYRDIGFKLGEWATVGLYQKALNPLTDDPQEPLPLSRTPAWRLVTP